MVDDGYQPCQSASGRCWRTGRQSGDGPHKRGINTKIHLAVDAHGMPVRFFITSGTKADCTITAQLMEGFRAKYLLADRGYDTDAIIDDTICCTTAFFFCHRAAVLCIVFLSVKRAGHLLVGKVCVRAKKCCFLPLLK